MIRCAVEDLASGMVLGKSLFDHNGALLLASGQRLDSGQISGIKSRGFYSVLIFKDGTEEIILEDVISEEVRLMTIRKVQANIDDLQERVRKFLPENEGDIAHNLRERKGFEECINIKELKYQLQYILEELMALDVSQKFSGTLRSVSAYQYEHSIDVTLLAAMLGIVYNYNFHELLQLGTAAMLHDIGKVVIPAIADKSENDLRIDERILFKEHPVFGSILLEKSTTGYFMERAAILQHHERQDGNGYPLHKSGLNLPPTQSKQTDPNRIFRFSEIIAVANTYDNLIAPRPGHKPMSPEEALEAVDTEAGMALNSHIVKKLGDIINLYPKGSLVKIESCTDTQLVGFSGAVKDFKKKTMMMELILFKDAAGNEISPRPHVFENDSKLRLKMELMG